MNPLTNTVDGRVVFPASAANLTPGLIARLDANGKAALAGASTRPVVARFVVYDSTDVDATLLPIETGRQVRVTLAADCDINAELASTADSKATPVENVAGGCAILVAEEAGVAGQMVLCRGLAHIAPDELPAIEEGDAGKVLTVNEAEDGAEWTDIPAELPPIEEGDAGKMLAVNAGETAPEWKTPPASAPAPTTGDAGKLVMVKADETGLELAFYMNVPGGANWGATVGGVMVFQVTDACVNIGTSSIPAVLQINVDGSIVAPALPTTDPAVAGQLWNDGGTLKVSAGGSP